MAERALVEIAEDFEPSPYVARAIVNSDCRTPVVFVEEDGDPFISVCAVAKKLKSAVWNFDLSRNRSATNIMDYIDVGVNNGDWVFVSNCDAVEETFFRDVARTLYQLKPQPERFPRRESFRAFFTVQRPFDPNGPGKKPFPTLFLQFAIIARSGPSSASKWTRMLPADDPLYTIAQEKHARRRQEGRDSDSESDIDEGDHVTGKLFFRSAERYATTDHSPVTEAKEIFETAVKDQDVAVLKKLVENAEVDLSKPLSCGMTAIQLSCCLQLTESAIALLDLGASPNEPRASDGRPPLFMALEDVRLAQALVDSGADLFAKYEGYRADSHPDTAPCVATYLSHKISEVEV